MSDKETLNFKITLSGTGSPVPCKFQILINDNVYISETTKPQETDYQFNADIFEGNYSLKIKLLDKSSKHVNKDNNGQIIEDFLLNICKIEIDEIDLGQLLWSHSKYMPIYPSNYDDVEQKKITEIKNCVNLGWNGTWELPFTSPFYIWLLENI